MKNLFSTAAILFMSYHLTHKLGLLTLKKKNGSANFFKKFLHDHFVKPVLSFTAKADDSPPPINFATLVAFDIFDQNHDGLISIDECIQALGVLGITNVPRDDIKKLFDAADKNNDRLISLDEFNEIAKIARSFIKFN